MSLAAARAAGASLACRHRRLHAPRSFTNVYFVVEHQPNACSEYPANGFIDFTDITIVWEGGGAPTWTAQQFQPACNSQATIVSPSHVRMTWTTTGEVDTAASLRGAAPAAPTAGKWAMGGVEPVVQA